MDFGQKLKEIRKIEGLSQEQLAEKIGVSRQAITKWETGKGLPDIENMMILAEIFKTTLDDLVSQAMPQNKVKKPMFHSETIYDVDCNKHFDINLGSAKTVTICSGTDEKLHIDLASETLENIGSLFKIKLDENREKLDVDCIKKKGLSKFEITDTLSVTITLPVNYTKHCELAASVKELDLVDLVLERLEYDGDAEKVIISNCIGSIEFTSKTDYDITVDKIHGKLDVNQWFATSIVHIPQDTDFRLYNKGRGCDVYWQKNGDSCEPCDNPDSENILGISGIKSELIVDLM